MLFAATLLLCAVPFPIVVAALEGKSAATAIGRRMGLNTRASAHFSQIFATPGATQAAVIGTTGMVFFVLGGSFLNGSVAGPAVRHAGPVVFAIAALVWYTGFWWLTLWLMVAGRISWRRLFPCACATGLFWLGMMVVFSFFISGMVISEDKEYGPIGIIFALMSFLIAIGVVVILGAVVGLVWQERNLSFTAGFRKLRRAR